MATLRFYVCFMLTFTLVAGQSAYYVLKAREAILTPALTKPPDDILWKHNGEKVITFDSAEERVFAPYHDRVLLAWDTAQLSITDVRYEDSGEYELDANVNGRLYRSQYLLKVLDKVSKPVITCEMSDDESSSNGSTAVRATLSCSSQSMTPEALKFKWNLEGKSHLGPALSIALGNDLDDITYSCTANNPLHAETSVFTAKDCYTEKSSQALDILVPIIIASLILLAFCLFPFIFRHQIKRACFMNGKNNDLEKQLQAAAADSAQNNEERAQLLTDLHRQETIPSQQRLPKQSSVMESGVDNATPGKVKELRKRFQPSEHPETNTAQTNGNVGPVTSQPVSPSSSVPKTSAGLMASGGKSALNSEDLQNTDTDSNRTDPEEYQDAQEEAQSTHTDQVQQNMEPTSGGQLNSDQAESEAESEADEHRENQKEAEPDEPTRTRVQQDDTQSTNKGQDVMVEAKQEREENDLSLTGTASKQPELLESTAAPVLPVKSGSKERIDANEETNTDMVEVDPQKDLSKKETMALKEKELEMSREHPAQSSSPPDQGLAAPEVTQRPDDEDSDTEEVAPQKDPEEGESAEEEEPELAKKAETPDALSPQAPVQGSSSQDQDSKPEDREKVEEAQTNGNDGPATSQHVSPSSCAGKTSACLIPPGGEPDLISEDHQNTDTDPNHTDPEEYQDAPEETQSTHTDQVQQNMEPTLPAQSSSPPDQGLAAPEVTQRPDGGEDSDTEEVASQKDPEESESAEEEEPELAKKAEKPDALLPQARAESSSSQDQDSKPEDKEKVDCAEDSNSDSIVNPQHEDQKVTSDHNGTESNDKSELSNKVNSPADNTSSAPPFDGCPLPESDKDQPLTSEPSGVKDKSDKEMDTDTVDPQIQDSPSKESEESKLTNSSVPGSEEQESTHPPDSSLSPPTDENEEPKDADAEPKDEADKAQAVKLDADKL